MGYEENSVVQACLDLLQYKHIEAWRNNNQAVYDPSRSVFRRPAKGCIPGVPDIAGYFSNGVALFVECKKKGGKPSPDQKKFIEKALKAGCFAVCVDNGIDLDIALTKWFNNLKG